MDEPLCQRVCLICIGAVESLFDLKNAAYRGARRDLFELTRHPHGRATEREAAAELAQQMNVGAGDAAMGDVTEDGDVEILNRAFAIANGQSV